MQSDLFASSGGVDLDLPGAKVIYFSAWLDAYRAQRLLADCLAELHWEQPSIRVAGKTHKIPRQQVWAGDPQAVYRYSGKTFVPVSWPAFLLPVKMELERQCDCQFNSALLNWYRSGADGMGFHADDEPELGHQPVIASLTLGGPRRFVLKHKQATYPAREIQLQHGDLLVMGGDTQKHWIHGVPKTKKWCDERVNITFRKITRL